MSARRGKVLVISGVGGAGKGTIIDRLRAQRPDLWWSVSWATRPPRPGEVDGVHYHFRTREQFEAEIARDGFLEWFEPYGHLKGTPKAPILEQIEAGHDVLLELDVDGARAVCREFGADARVVFLVAPSADEQAQRLRGRGDAAADIETRMTEARREYDAAVASGFTIVVNDDVNRVFDQVVAILDDSTGA
jgi:guanylate kinase